ncbi:MAG: cell division protein FtsZ [Rhodospirillaceae bacterium]|nr:MAG: cell division protein FtsZ [Rhodospirillaceae bacterium]
MTLNLSLPQDPFDIRPKITVVGVGGAGGNAVSNMIRSKLEGVEFLVANTDAQALQQSLCERRIQLGATVTKGLGAGARPDIGRASAEEAIRDIAEQLAGSNMAFITAGMGGGTGTGAAPVIAQIAREQGILTVGVVTKPFHFEGSHRMRMAEQGIQDLQQYVDTLIIIPNQNLFRIANEKTTFADAFKMADEVLHSGVRGVTDLMVMPGLINLDFADIRAVMSEMGKAMMGTGEANGENRAIAAAEAAISNPLLDEVSMKGARGVLINITGGMDMTLFEVDEAANRIRDEVDPEANIIFGSTFDQSLEGKIRISVVATGIEAEVQAQPRPAMANLSLVARNPNPQPSGNDAGDDRSGYRDAPAPAPMTAQPVAQASTQPNVPQPMTATGLQARGMAQAYAAQPATAAAPAMPSAPMPTSIGATALQSEPAMVRMPERQVERQPERQTFVAPPAVEAATRPQAFIADPVTPQPVAEAAPERKRVPSLFEKVTSRFTSQPASRPVEQRPAAPAPQAPRLGQPTYGLPSFARPQTQAAPAQPTTYQPAHQPAHQPVNNQPAGGHHMGGHQMPNQPVMAQPEIRQPEVRAEPRMQQPQLQLEPTERVSASRAEEDLLDIPAFLRRQAN